MLVTLLSVLLLNLGYAAPKGAPVSKHSSSNMTFIGTINSLTVGDDDDNAGIGTILPLSSLQNLVDIFLPKVMTEAEATGIPDISGSTTVPLLGKVNYKFTDFKLYELSYKSCSVSKSPFLDSLYVSAKGITLDVDFAWSYKAENGFFGKGTATATATTASYLMSLLVTASGGKPKIAIKSSAFTMGDLNVQIKGSVVSGLYQLILEAVKTTMTSSIESDLSASMESELQSVINAETAALTMSYTLEPGSNGVLLDYELTKSPDISSFFVSAFLDGGFKTIRPSFRLIGNGGCRLAGGKPGKSTMQKGKYTKATCQAKCSTSTCGAYMIMEDTGNCFTYAKSAGDYTNIDYYHANYKCFAYGDFCPESYCPKHGLPVLDNKFKGVNVLVDEFMLNSAGWAYHVQGLLKKQLNPGDVPSGYPNFLNTKFWNMFVPGLTLKYPDNDMKALVTSRAPVSVDIEKTGNSIMTAPVDLSFSVMDGRMQLSAFTLACDGHAGALFSINSPSTGSRVVPTLKTATCNCSLINSTVGSVNTAQLTAVFSIVGQLVVKTMNEQMATGIPFPQVPDIVLVNSALTFGDHEVQVSSDFASASQRAEILAHRAKTTASDRAQILAQRAKSTYAKGKNASESSEF